MGWFFLTTLWTFGGARLLLGLGLGPKKDGRVEEWVLPWYPGAVAFVVLAIVALLRTVSASASLDGAGVLGFFYALLITVDDPVSASVIGGILAGIMLFEGFRRVPSVTDSDEERAVAEESYWKTVMTARVWGHGLLAATLFLVVALVAHPGFLARVRALDAGGVKLELHKSEVVSRPATLDRHGGLAAFAQGGLDESSLLHRLIVDQDESVIRVDREIVTRLANKDQASIAAPLARLAAHEAFFTDLAPHIRCLAHYVKRTNDRRIVPSLAIDAAHAFLMMERILHADPIGPPPRELHATAERLAGKLLVASRGMAEALGDLPPAGRPADAVDHCAHAVATETRKIAEARRERIDALWRLESRRTPHMALGVAWIAATFGDPELGVRTLLEWIHRDHDLQKTRPPDAATAWFRVRAWIQLLNVMHDRHSTEPASRTEKIGAAEAMKAVDALPGQPDLAGYSREKVAAVHRCPGYFGGPPQSADARLFHTRIYLLTKRLEALAENPQIGELVTADHVRLARHLRDSETRCIPHARYPDYGKGQRAHALLTYGQVALAWAARGAETGQLSQAQAKSLRTEATIAIIASEEMLTEQHDPADRVRAMPDRVLTPADWFSMLVVARRLANELRAQAHQTKE